MLGARAAQLEDTAGSQEHARDRGAMPRTPPPPSPSSALHPSPSPLPPPSPRPLPLAYSHCPCPSPGDRRPGTLHSLAALRAEPSGPHVGGAARALGRDGAWEPTRVPAAHHAPRLHPTHRAPRPAPCAPWRVPMPCGQQVREEVEGSQVPHSPSPPGRRALICRALIRTCRRTMRETYAI
jgi:hypothetical protein